MSKLGKKILVSAVAAVMVASVAVPAPADAQTVEELQAQISALLAQINSLQAQIAALSGGTTGGGISGIPAGFTFTTNLGQGSSGSDVMYLQMLLNSNAATQVAATGVGSSGQETQFYGPLTAAAVTKFQNVYASEVLAPLGLASGTGFFGPSSRAKANTLLAVAPTPTPTPTPTLTPTPTPTPGISTPGVEGSLIVTVESTPASGATLNLNESEAVSAVKVKATGSDILVDRFDMEFDTRPWLYIAEMTVSDGSTSKTVAVTESNSVEVTVGSKYYVRMSGLNMLVPKDAEKVLTVTVKAISGLPAGTTTKDVVLTVIADSIRGTDGAGLTQTAPTAALSTRTITVKEGDTASIEISAHSDNPKARPVIVKSTTETTDVVLAVFNAKATGNDAILRTMEVKDSTASTTGPIDVLYLYDGSTLLSSTSSITSASATLANIDLTITKDTTKVLTLKGTIRKAQGNYESAGSSTIDAGAASSNITVGADSLSFSAEDATSFATATVTGSDVTPQAAYYYIKAPTLALVSTSVTGLTAPSGSLTPQQAEAKIRVNVTANGGDIYVPFFDSVVSASNGILVATSTASVTLTGETITSNAEVAVTDDLWVVRSGDTKYFEYIGTLTDGSGTNGMGTTGQSVFAKITDFRWGDTQAKGLGNGLINWLDTDFWTNFKTSAVFLQAPN